MTILGSEPVTGEDGGLGEMGRGWQCRWPNEKGGGWVGSGGETW